MSGPSGERCGICYYCADPNHDGTNGWCHRYPGPYTNDKDRGELWTPEVSVNHWW
jgi:hypothetical protein